MGAIASIFSPPKMPAPLPLPAPVTPAAPDEGNSAAIGEARRRAARAAALSGGRPSTILTGGGGLATDASTTGKTLLGR